MSEQRIVNSTKALTGDEDLRRNLIKSIEGKSPTEIPHAVAAFAVSNGFDIQDADIGPSGIGPVGPARESSRGLSDAELDKVSGGR